MTEARVEVDLTLGRIVDEFDGDELVPGQLEHGQVAQGGFGDAADDLVADGGIERERSVEIGDTQAEMQRPHRCPPCGRYTWMAVPLGNVRASIRSSLSGSRSALNRPVPWPIATGWITSRDSSISPSRINASTKVAPPWARITPPGSRLSRSMSSTRSPLAIRLSAQSARVSVLENTTLGTSFITSAYTPVVVGHTDAIASYVARPMMCVPARRNDETFHATTSSSSGGSPQSS